MKRQNTKFRFIKTSCFGELYRFLQINLCLLVLCSLSCQEKNTSVTLIVGGDILLDRGVALAIEQKGLQSLFDSVRPLLKAHDFVLANLECPLTDTYTPIPKRFSFRAPTHFADSLQKTGFSHLFLANNHTNDHNREGLVSTYQALQKHQLIGIGFGFTHQESCQPIFLEKNGERIAFFSVVDVPLENWFFLEHKPSICQQSLDELALAIEQLKKDEPQTLIFVSLHWGTEYRFEPELIQRKAAKKIVQAGADAIIGHHPHVTQRIEFIAHKPVLYSLGNFVFDQQDDFKDVCILSSFVIEQHQLKAVYIYPLHIKDARPQFFTDKSREHEFMAHLKKLSQNVLFERDKNAFHIQVSEN